MGRIIVIEDNIIYSDFVCRLLENKGYQSVATSTCNGARKLFTKMQEDDIVLADMRLPDGDGIGQVIEIRCGGFYPQEPVGNEFATAPESLTKTVGTPRSTDLRAAECGFP